MRCGLPRQFWLMLVLILAITTAAIALPRLHRMALLGSGYMAQMLCAGIFVSKRDLDDLMTRDLSGPRLGLLHFFQPELDRDAKRVSASLYGIAGQTSIYRSGLGCTLIDGMDEATLRAQAAGLFASAAAPNSDAEWPEGENVSAKSLPNELDGEAARETIEATLRPQAAGFFTSAAAPNSDAEWPEGENVSAKSLPNEVDGEAARKAIEAIFVGSDPAHPRRTHALVVVYEGRIVAERYAPGFSAHMPLIGWSMSKTATNVLVGLRVMDGKLALDEDALIPEWRAEDDPRRAITLDDLMHMTSGLAFAENHADNSADDAVQMLFVEGDAARFAAAKALAHRPGKHWAYSSGTTNIISRVLRGTFENESDYLRFPHERLFGRLGMKSAVLQPDASGIFLGSSFLYASARDWARLGLLFLRGGEWLGERFLPASWIRYTLEPSGQSPDDRYGAQVWLKLPESPGLGEPPLPEDAYYMLGYDGQVVAIVPSHDLVIVRLGLSPDGGLWDNAWDLGRLVAAFPRTGPDD